MWLAFKTVTPTERPCELHAESNRNFYLRCEFGYGGEEHGDNLEERRENTVIGWYERVWGGRGYTHVDTTRISSHRLQDRTLNLWLKLPSYPKPCSGKLILQQRDGCGLVRV